MNSPPSLPESDLTEFFFPWVKKKPFKNLKTIPILVFYEYGLHLGLLWCQQYFRFWDCFFSPPDGRKKPFKSLLPPSFPGRSQKMYTSANKKKPYPFGMRDISPNLNLSRTTIVRTYSKEIIPEAQFSSARFSA